MVKYFCCTFLLLLCSCSSMQRSQQNQYRDLVEQKKFSEALEFIEKSKVYKDDKSILLKEMELGMINFYQANYKNALVHFDRAQFIVNKLFTKSFKEKIASGLFNESSKSFIGRPYERSYLYLFRVLSFIELYKSDNQHSNYLQKARATILAWHKYLEDLKNYSVGESVYKDDILAKVLGAQIHLMMNTSSDRQIALSLLIKARELLVKSMGAYSSMNKKYKEYRKNFSKFHLLGEKTVRKKFIDPTSNFLELEKVLDFNVLRIASRISKKRFSRLEKVISDGKKIGAKAKKERNDSYSLVLVFDGMISPYAPQKVYFGLKGIKNKGLRFSAEVLTLYAASVLGLTPGIKGQSVAKANFGLRYTQLIASEAAISFELPVVKKIDPFNNFQLVRGQDILELAPLINIGELAQQSISVESNWLYPKIGARLAGKHLTAIATSYLTYKTIKKQSGEFFAKSAAMLEYLALSKAIEQSEFADLRHWATLPSSVSFSFVKDLESVKSSLKVKDQLIPLTNGKSGITFYWFNK